MPESIFDSWKCDNKKYFTPPVYELYGVLPEYKTHMYSQNYIKVYVKI